MADAILDRVLHNAYKMELDRDGESMRRMRTMIDATEPLGDINPNPAAHPSGVADFSRNTRPTSTGTAGRLASE
jgi:hypothetical protein